MLRSRKKCPPKSAKLQIDNLENRYCCLFVCMQIIHFVLQAHEKVRQNLQIATVLKIHRSQNRSLFRKRLYIYLITKVSTYSLQYKQM
jgi:predicted XRE-type DNA-binding protein